MGLGKGRCFPLSSSVQYQEDLKYFSLCFIANPLQEAQLPVTRLWCFPVFLFSAELLLLPLDTLHDMAMVN